MNPYTIVARIAFSCCLLGGGALGLPASATEKAETPTIAQARELIDSYYGNDNLKKAGELLERAYKENPEDPHFFVQASRVVVMGGQLGYGNTLPTTQERYGALLDRAMALDDANAKAHILKARFFAKQKQYEKQLSELDKAKALGTKDPWLLIGYAEYYRSTGSTNKAFLAYSDVASSVPVHGFTASDRRAYVSALYELKSLLAPGEDAHTKLREHAALALKGRHPDDAWSPLGYAEDFVWKQLFDEAIFYAREALRTMDFGAARLALASSLYGKAAQLTVEGKPSAEIQPLVDEAGKFGFPKTTILEYFEMHGEKGRMGALRPALNTIVPASGPATKRPSI